jgi:hypothetical protein
MVFLSKVGKKLMLSLDGEKKRKSRTEGEVKRGW